MDTVKDKEDESSTSFKKPMLVGKIGRLPKRMNAVKTITKITNPDENNSISEFKHPAEISVPSGHKVADTVKGIPYEEPVWSGLPKCTQTEYILEVLKNGSIIETINLMKKPLWVFGRLNNCDICMQHPTISRYHAVLQYKSENSDTEGTGFYIYDLESTHGTFLNKNRLKSRSYVKMHVGHMLKLGCSTRTYILNGPDDDAEEESPLSITEIKQKRQEELRQREIEKQQEEEIRKKQEEKGIDWGLGEDADEEADLSENPYAATNNEELYIDNPKKALRGFFEREGLELEYDCTEQGMGQFLCKVELPIDDELGRPIFAEVFHKGKKKEAVVQCALEACRVLDRHGLLRQATHESRKRKPKNWEENDYYDSDDDTFLDRTGAIEKKRQMRMKAKTPQKPETYESLLEKEKEISKSIKELESELVEVQRKFDSQTATSSAEADSLDSFMMELKQSKPNKRAINKLKFELAKLKQQHGNIIKLVNIAKPASLPPLVPDYLTNSTATISEKKSYPIIGKRRKIHLALSTKVTHQPAEDDCMDTEIGNDTENEPTTTEENSDKCSENCLENTENLSVTEFEKFLKQQGDHLQDKLEEISDNLKKLRCDPSCSQAELKSAEVKQNEVTKILNIRRKSESVEEFDKKISSELIRISNELKIMVEQKTGNINESSIEVKNKFENEERSSTKEMDHNLIEKKRKNQRRIQQKQEIGRQKGYTGDESREDYNMWVPPSNQSGDGRTALNDKYGY